MLKKSFYLIILILLSISVLAQQAGPPFQTAESDSGLVISSPLITSIRIGQGIDFHTHIFNKTNGAFIYTNAGCFFHLYNGSGNHLVTAYDGTPSNIFDYELSVGGNNFSKAGYYALLIQCNATAPIRGGETRFQFEVTKDGYPFPSKLDFENNDILMLIIIITQMFMIAFFVFIGLPHKVGFVKISSWGLAFIEFLMLIWLVYLNFVGGEITTLLFINAISAIIIGGSFGTYTLIVIMLRMSNPANNKPVEEDGYTKFMNGHDFKYKPN